MKHLYLILILVFITINVKSQNPGDTIIVKSFNYSQTHGNPWSGTIRDTVIGFPTNSSINYEKVLMYYNLRCKNALVSPPVSGQTNIGCGEWDYSCNTYIEDSSRVDSFYSSHANYSITNFSGANFDYVGNPMNAYYQYLQKLVILNGTPTDTQSTVSSGSLALNNIIAINSLNAKQQYLYSATELTTAGASVGNLDGIILNVASGSSVAKFFRIRLKQTTKTHLSDSLPDNSGFTEVYFHNTNFVSGQNRFQFYTPFAWDGISNIIIEISYSNNQPSSAISFTGSQLSQNITLKSTDDNAFVFDGANYIETDNYKGIAGTTPRTVEAWIKTSTSDKEIVSWGNNQGGAKWVFRVNGNGALRVEVNGGYTYGSTLLNDGNWHHVACTFQGSSVNNIKLYVDGNLETNLTTSNRTINTDTANGINLRVSRGINNRYFNGIIDEVRLWDTELSQNTLRKWMYAKLNNTHINYSNLQIYYPLNENQGGIINDSSVFARNAHQVNGFNWNSPKGIDLFKSFETSQKRPNTTFLQGNYNLTITTDTIIDTIALAGNNVKQYQILSHSGSLISDEIILVLDTTYWPAGNEYTYDAATGNIIDTTTVAADGTLNISQLTYTRRSPMRFEIMSFVTPYGINLDLGPNGKTWTFDVTDFLPILQGDKRITIEKGGQWQEDMDIQFAFIVGTPPQDILDITQLWPVHYKSNSDIINDRGYEPRDVMLNANAIAFKVRSTITGHGQEGEFIPRNHYLNIGGGSNEFTWQVWKSDCGENPIYPQGGTWIYNRAGWCPGAATMVKQNYITPYVTPGQTANIDYNMASATGTSKYIVSHQLVSYGSHNFSLDIAATEIQTPSSKVEYLRENYICNNPTCIIENKGSTAITSATIKYWVNGNQVKNTFNWTGLLNFGESTEVSLPADSALWSSLVSGENNFHIEVQNPNGGTDEYAHNNKVHSKFIITDVVPSDFYIMFRSNLAPNETSYKIYDENGTEVHHSNNFAANTIYKDTVQLGVGCYKLEILDSDGDGLSFFANNDGTGFLMIRDFSNHVIHKIEPNFGSSYIYNFTVDYPLSYEQLQKQVQRVEIFPNPSNGVFNIEFGNEKAKYISVSNVFGQEVYSEQLPMQSASKKLQLTHLKSGVYFINLHFENREERHKVIIR